MFYELMSYDLLPGSTGKFLDLCHSRGLPIRGDKYGRLEGFWQTDIGRQDRVHHLWSHASIEVRQAARVAMARDQAWQNDFLPYCLPLMQEAETRFLSLLCPVAQPPASGGEYEIRFTTLKPLKGKFWFERMSQAQPLLERHALRVGAWQNIAGRPYEIVSLWWYSSGDARQKERVALASDEVWHATKSELADFVVSEETALLAPTPFSPMQ